MIQFLMTESVNTSEAELTTHIIFPTLDGYPSMSQEAQTTEADPPRTQPTREKQVTIITRGLLRIALALVGFLLLLFAIGQAFGLNLLGLFAEFTQTWTGQWLLVAAFALVLIIIALKGWGRTRAA